MWFLFAFRSLWVINWTNVRAAEKPALKGLLLHAPGRQQPSRQAEHRKKQGKTRSRKTKVAVLLLCQPVHRKPVVLLLFQGFEQCVGRWSGADQALVVAFHGSSCCQPCWSGPCFPFGCNRFSVFANDFLVLSTDDTMKRKLTKKLYKTSLVVHWRACSRRGWGVHEYFFSEAQEEGGGAAAVAAAATVAAAKGEEQGEGGEGEGGCTYSLTSTRGLQGVARISQT